MRTAIRAKPHPRFSFVIPVYDRTRVVYECVLSCLNQTYDDFEVIIVLDGSPPNTIELVNSFAGEKKVKIFKYENPFGTACRARNRGILEAQGDYICLLDSDDISNPDRLAETSRVIDKTAADVVYGAVRFLVDEGRHIEGITFGDVAIPNQAGFSLKDLIACNQIYTLTASIRRSTLLKFGGFRTEMRYREDYELWLRLKFNGASFAFTNHVLSLYRIHGGNNELNFKEKDDVWYQKSISVYRDLFTDWGVK